MKVKIDKVFKLIEHKNNLVQAQFFLKCQENQKKY